MKKIECYNYPPKDEQEAKEQQYLNDWQRQHIANGGRIVRDNGRYSPILGCVVSTATYQEFDGEENDLD